MEVVLITGASRGLGAALAEALLSAERKLICIARQPNPNLAQQAQARGAWLDYYLQDLNRLEATDELSQSICDELPENASRYVLINNAGVMEPAAHVTELPFDGLMHALNVNVAAAMILTSRFLKATENFAGQRRILNISSGAGRRPFAGWSAYCSCKAALDMFSRCVKEEQNGARNPARVVSIAPGVIDTEMQAAIRGLDERDFPNVQHFVELKAAQKLASASETAQRLIAYLDRADFGDTEIDDIRNY